MSRRRNKSFGYYARRVISGIILIGGALYGGEYYYIQQQSLHIEDILANSVLKGRKFQAQVQPLQSGEVSAYFLEEHSNPIVSIRFAFQYAGVAYETEEKSGLSPLLAEMLTAGGGKYDAETFKELCAEYGIKVGFSAGKDDFGGWLQFPREYMREAVQIFQAALYFPHFDEDYLNVAKAQQLMLLKMQKERPEKVLAEEFKQFLFAGHPYERNALGRPEIVTALTAEDLEENRQTKLARSNLLVALAGDLSADEAKQLLDDLFGALPAENDGEKLVPLTIETSGAELAVHRKSAQAVMHFAAQGTFRNSVDFYPLYMANYIFGEAGLTSRLNKHIREEKGLTYGIYTYLSISDAAALIEGGFSATPDNFTQAKEILLAEWQRLSEEGVSAQELDAVKKSLLASYNLRFAEIDGIAEMLLAMQKYGLGIDFLDKRNDYIAEVSLQEVNAAAKKYFRTAPNSVYIGAQKEKENKK